MRTGGGGGGKGEGEKDEEEEEEKVCTPFSFLKHPSRMYSWVCFAGPLSTSQLDQVYNHYHSLFPLPVAFSHRKPSNSFHDTKKCIHSVDY